MDTNIVAMDIDVATIPNERTLFPHSETIVAMEGVIINSLADSHGPWHSVTKKDVAQVIDLINYLVCDYSTLRAIFAPGAIFWDLSVDAKILYDDIKHVESEGIAPCSEGQKLQKSKFTSLCETFNQIWKDMITLRLHFERSGYVYTRPPNYDLIGDKCGDVHHESLINFFGALTIDLSAADSPFYSCHLQPKDEEGWAKFWAETPHPSMVEKYVVAERASTGVEVKIQKRVTFADAELPNLTASNPPAKKRPLSPSSEPGKAALNPEAIATPKKAEPEYAFPPSPPLTAKKPTIKLIHDPKSNALKSTNTKGPHAAPRLRKPRAPKSKIVKFKYSKRLGKTIANILASENKTSWKLFDDMETETGAKRQRAGRRAAKVAENKIKKTLKGEMKPVAKVTKNDFNHYRFDNSTSRIGAGTKIKKILKDEVEPAADVSESGSKHHPSEDGANEMEAGTGLGAGMTPMVVLRAYGGKHPL